MSTRSAGSVPPVHAVCVARRVLTILLWTAATVASGCSYALGPQALVGGREYPRDRLTHLSRGMTVADVRFLLGDPVEARSQGERTTWRYRALYRQRGCEVALFGVIPIDRPAKKWFETTLVFDRERLQSATDVEGAPEATHSGDILPVRR